MQIQDWIIHIPKNELGIIEVHGDTLSIIKYLLYEMEDFKDKELNIIEDLKSVQYKKIDKNGNSSIELNIVNVVHYDDCFSDKVDLYAIMFINDEVIYRATPQSFKEKKEENAIKFDFDNFKKQYINSMFTFEWDYNGVSTRPNFFGNQNAWNQTLIASINIISTNVHQAQMSNEYLGKSLFKPGSANTIIVNRNTLKLLNTLETYTVSGSDLKSDTMSYDNLYICGKISNRYLVLVSEDCEDNIIYIFNRYHPGFGGKVKIKK